MPQQSTTSISQPTEAYTQEFNFPKAWVREYNPQLHGFHSRDISQAPQPVRVKTHSIIQSTNQPQLSLTNHQTGSHHNWHNTSVKWNPEGIYGGVIEAKKGLPTRIWILIAVALTVAVVAVGMILLIS